MVDNNTTAYKFVSNTDVLSQVDIFLSRVLCSVLFMLTCYLISVTSVYTRRKKENCRNFQVNKLYLLILTTLLVDVIFLSSRLILTNDKYARFCTVIMSVHVTCGVFCRFLNGIILFLQSNILYESAVVSKWYTKLNFVIVVVMGFFCAVLAVCMAFIWSSASEEKCVTGHVIFFEKIICIIPTFGISVSQVLNVFAVCSFVFKTYKLNKKRNIKSRIAKDLSKRFCIAIIMMLLTDFGMMLMVGLNPKTLILPGIVVFHFNVIFNLTAFHFSHMDFMERLFPFCY